jgi:hypothetical protein
MQTTTETLVAMAPVMTLVIAGLVVTVGPKLTQQWNVFKRSKAKVETLKEVTAHLAFYGAHIAAFLGVEGDTALIATLTWFIALIGISFHLAHRIDKTDEHQP